ncbi:MAG: hypothetical protein H7Z10_15590 [Gemmatimonadaceae bacterium]|nr:hypothetical protein [Acetobacteraceae bacterium]
MRIAVVVMGILIVAGTVGLAVVVAGRMSSGSTPIASVLLDEPEGTRIAGAAAAPDRVVVQLQGGGPDRVVVVDTRSGRVLGRVGLAR